MTNNNNSVRSITIEAASQCQAIEKGNRVMGLRWIADSLTALGNGLWRLVYRQVTIKERYQLEEKH